MLHTYDELDNCQLLLTYGFVAAADEAALPPTARLRLSSLVAACAASRAAPLLVIRIACSVWRVACCLWRVACSYL